MDSLIGTCIEIEIEDLGSSGEGIGAYQGFKFFVDGVLPGELIEIEVTVVKKNYGMGKLKKIIKPSPARVKPICPVFDRCGGCQIMHLDYSKQLEVKRKKVVEALRRIGKMELKEVPNIVASPLPLYYRNKIQLPASGAKHSLKLGLYEKKSHQVVPVERCFIHTSLGEKVYEKVKKILESSSIEPYDEVKKEGELRHVLLRTAVNTNEVLVVLVTSRAPSPLLKKIGEDISQIQGVKGVIHHKNSRVDNVVLDREFTILYGQSFIQEKLGELLFKISAASFFQVNTFQAENVYKRAIELSNVTESSVVLDAYCGIGTLSLLLSKKAKEVIGVECVAQAIDDAKENAFVNKIENVRFVCAHTEKVIHTFGKIETVVLNPPRRGCDIRVLDELKRLKPKTIIYISCDPATLARDAAILISYGFKVDFVECFDMFPQTMHVETIIKFVCQ